MLGIIGGNGVAATNRLCTLVEEGCTKNGAYRDGHHPEMIIWQATQAPSRSMYLEGRGPSWIEDYCKIGLKLKACGCTKLCMCCNTAHYVVHDLEKKIGLPFINILSLVAEKCKISHCKRIGIMCTDGLRKKQIYDNYIHTLLPNAIVIYPDPNYQNMATLGICNAKNEKRFDDIDMCKEHPANCFNTVCRHLIDDKDVDCIVAGCTDINNVYSPGEMDVTYIDSLQVLSDYIIESEFKKP